MSPPSQLRVQHNKETAEATVVLQLLQHVHFHAEEGASRINVATASACLTSFFFFLRKKKCQWPRH